MCSAGVLSGGFCCVNEDDDEKFGRCGTTSSDDEAFVRRLLDAKGTVYPDETVWSRSRKNDKGREGRSVDDVDNKPAVA